jgi:hypothetical protein
MKTYIIIAVFLVISGLMQHFTHELMHIIAGRLCGLSLVSVKWFGSHGGTKVTFEGEEEVLKRCGEGVPWEWVVMNIAGIAGTTALAYLFTAVYLLLPAGYAKLFFWVLSAMFLVTDAGYSVICAFGDCGDLYLVNRYLKKEKLMKLASVLLLALNIAVFIAVRAVV